MEVIELQAIYKRAEDCYRQGLLDEAKHHYQTLLREKPDLPPTLNGLGRVLHKQKRYSEAIQLFQRLIQLCPDEPVGYKNLGAVLCEKGDLVESFEAFRRQAELAYQPPELEKAPDNRRKHAKEQAEYLKNHLGLAGDTFHIENGSPVEGLAVNPRAGTEQIDQQWRENRPQLIVVDDFLSDDALQKLRHYCLGSTIWRLTYTSGYIGALPEHGLGSPLLAQIAYDMRRALPNIIGDHPLRQFWGFIYDSEMKGIDVHADFAATNVNFWITPDEANLDPNSGGLKVWDVPAPLDWDFHSYNDNADKMRAFLAENHATATTIPYRCNRAVIFNSNLFHETDTIHFKPGYANRRINLTMLFGDREKT